MSELTDYKQSADSASRKRSPSPGHHKSDTIPSKSTKLNDESNEQPSTSQSGENDHAGSKGAARSGKQAKDSEGEAAYVQTHLGSDSTAGVSAGPGNDSAEALRPNASPTEKSHLSDSNGSFHAEVGAENAEHRPSTSMDQSDSAAIAAAEALASLTGGDGEDGEDTPWLPKRAKQEKTGFKIKCGRDSLKRGFKTQAATADSSTSVHSVDREDASDAQGAAEGDDSTPGLSSTPSSSYPSDNEDNDDWECAIVSVKMAPEIRQSVALLAQVQMKLEALDKKSARLHQRLELKMSRQRRPHLDQRSSITQSIPGFWVTALLNHPHLSAQIDETDEDALSYMTDLEIETFKNDKLGYRIRFHFKRNPYFQNNVIMKELHLGIGGSPASYSNPILWHRGQNLTAHSEPAKTSRGIYQTFFNWFSDHSNPGRDDIAQILKDDLYKDPLRYYLTPLWEPRANGSSSSGVRAAENSNGDECVVISDSDDDQEQGEAGDSREEEEEEDEEEEDDDDDRGQDADETPEEEEDGEIVIDGSDESDQEAREHDAEEDIDVDEEDESKD